MTRNSILLAALAAALLAGCGGGSTPAPATAPAPAPAPTTFTISTSAGANGTISPSSKPNIPAGATAEFFVVTPSAGYRVASASGCGGEFVNTTSNEYWAGKNTPINANCTIAVTFEPISTLSAVAPRFPGNGAKWNDYVVGNSTSAADLACNASTDTACVHGGEQRLVVVTGKTSCADLSASDDLAAFTWHCQIGNNGTAQFISSTGLSAGNHLSNLIDFTLATPAFKPNKVTVFAPGGKWSETPATQWWPDNPIVRTTPSSGNRTSLSTPSTIYVLTSADPTGQFTLDADKVALVIRPGVTLSGPGGGSDSYVIDSAASRRYVWLEGAIDASGDDIGVNLIDPRFFALRNLRSNGADGGNRNTSPDSHNIGILVRSGTNNRLEDLTANGNFTAGIVLTNSSSNTVSRVTATSDPLVGTQNYGLWIRQSSSGNVVSDLTAGAPSATCTAANGNTDTGLWLSEGSVGNTVRIVKAYCNRTGVSIADSTSINNVLADITANSNRSNGVSVVADSSTDSPNTFEKLTVNNNGADGVGAGLYLVAVSGSKFTNVTANNNADAGIFLNSYFDQSNTGLTFGSNRNTFTTVEASGNAATRNIALDQSSRSRDNTFTGVSPATNCPLSGTNNSCSSTASTTPAVVEFRIAAGTGTSPWNTQSTMLTVTLGQTVRIINDDTRPHAFHADNGIPCAHQPVGSQLSTGQSYDCVTTAPVDPGAGPPTTWDHLYGPAASFWLRVVR